jgi:hypothetical protein
VCRYRDSMRVAWRKGRGWEVVDGKRSDSGSREVISLVCECGYSSATARRSESLSV